MKQFILEMLSGRSNVSSKRTAMWFFAFVFVFLCVLNAFKPDLHPTELFQNQLFEVLILLIMLVFGERALAAWQAIKGKKTEPPTPEQ